MSEKLPPVCPRLQSCGCLQSVSVAALGGAQGGAPAVNSWAVRGFLLPSLLLFPPALRGPPPHPQVVDPVGFWVGDLAEGHFVDGRVLGGDQQEEERREAEGPGAHWQPELAGDTTHTGQRFGTIFGLCAYACLWLTPPLGKLGGPCFPWRHSGHQIPTQLATQRSDCQLEGWGCTKHLTLQTSVLSEVQLQYRCWMEPATSIETTELGSRDLITSMTTKTPSSHMDTWIL